MKIMWKGYIKLSLVTIPVKMYNAVIKRRSIQFHQLHRDCKNRIREQKFCPVCDKVLADNDILRGYEYAKDSYVVISDEELRRAQKESTEAIEVVKMVDDRQIDPIYYLDSHYLVPDGKIGAEAFALFYKAMSEAKKTALAKMVMKNREHLLAIKPYNGSLIAYTLHYPEEIQGVDKIEEAETVGKVEVAPNGLAMARSVVENMSGDFVPEEYKDEYAEAVLQMVESKSKGEEIKVEPRAEKAKAINLMDALKKSVLETKRRGEAPKKAMATAGKRVKEVRIKRKQAA